MYDEYYTVERQQREKEAEQKWEREKTAEREKREREVDGTVDWAEENAGLETTENAETDTKTGWKKTEAKVSKYRPVSVAVGLVLGGVFAYEQSENAKPIDCANTFDATLGRDFIHTETSHFVSNMLALLLVSNVEAKVGSVQFLCVMGLILLISALVTMGLTSLFKLKCSIGFSGVLLGMMSYALVAADSKVVNWSALGVLVLTSVAPLLQANSRISVSGHLIGICTGLAVGLAARLVLFSSKKKDA